MDPFTKDYTGRAFQLFDIYHLSTLAVILLFNLSFFFLRKASPRTRKIVRYSMAAALILNEVAWHIWNWNTGQWNIQTMLPLHICSVFVFLSAVMLVNQDYRIYEIAFFLGIGPASQNLFTPDTGIYGFPHFRFFQGFISHGLIVSAPIYFTIVENYRPYWSSLWRSILYANFFMVFVAVINTVIGSNYLFICRPPDTPSLLDFLGPWPWYLLSLEAIALVVFTLLYSPFFLKDLLNKTRQNPQPVLNQTIEE